MALENDSNSKNISIHFKRNITDFFHELIIIIYHKQKATTATTTAKIYLSLMERKAKKIRVVLFLNRMQMLNMIRFAIVPNMANKSS